MPGQGLQNIPLRIPERWDAAWFASFVRDVLALADARNVIEGPGIEITGNSDVAATFSTSDDLQQLKDQNYIVAEPSAFLANERILAGQNGVVSIDDDGAGGDITVGIETHGIGAIQLRQSVATAVMGNPTNVPANLDDIAAASNDTVLRRVSDALDFGQLTVGMAPNDLWTYAKLQNVSATARILGRKTASAGDVEECTLSDILDFLGSAAQGDILYRGASGWAYLPPDTNGYVLTTHGAAADPTWEPSGGVGSSPWTNIVTQSFAVNTTGFTSNGSGTWGITGGELVQSVNNTNGPVFYYTTAVPYAAVRMQCDVYFTSAGAGSTQAIGFWMGPASPASTPTNSAALWLRNDSGTKTFKCELFGGSVFTSIANAFTLDAYHALEVVIVGVRHIVYLDGVVLASYIVTDTTLTGYERFGLFAYGGLAKFKNFTVDVGLSP